MRSAGFSRRLQAGHVQECLDDAEEAVRAIRQASPEDRPARIGAAIAALLEVQRQDAVLEGVVLLEKTEGAWTEQEARNE